MPHAMAIPPHEGPAKTHDLPSRWQWRRTLGVIVLMAAATIVAAQAPHPTITIDYLPLFDAECGEATGRPANPAAVEELTRRLADFREAWRRDAPDLLGQVPVVTGLPFCFTETRAALFVCQGFPSISLPLLINMRPYLQATAGGQVSPLVDFSNVVMHEVLHRYVGDVLAAAPDRMTPLLQKYAGEPHR